MALERRVLVDRDTRAADAGTVRYDLPRVGRCSAIGLGTRITNGATNNITEIIPESLDRVEVIADGSEVLASLSGLELYKWNFLLHKRRPPFNRTAAAGGVQELWLTVPFGRWLGDKELFLDFGNYRRVELVITFSPTIAATAFATGTTTFTVVTYEWPDAMALARRGFIRLTQIAQFTTVAAGNQDVELPRAYPHLAYGVFCREATIEDGVDLTNLEVREDTGVRIPYTGRWNDIQAENRDDFDLDCEEDGIGLLTDADTLDTHQTRITQATCDLIEDTGAADAAHPFARIATITADRLAFSVVETDQAGTQSDSVLATADYTIHWKVRGLGVGNFAIIPIGSWKDLEQTYDAPSKSKVELRHVQGAAGGDTRVSVAEMVPAA